jgi:hypothetical protein
MKPTGVNILGCEYSIEYVDNPASVDIHKRDSIWGQIDPWTRSIRIYDNGKPEGDVLQTVLHEVLHGIASELHLKNLQGDDHHEELDILALALADVLMRNGWLKE